MSLAPEILLYHRVAHGEPDNQYLSVSPENFQAHLDILCRKRKVMPLFDLVQAGLKGPLPEGAVAITFDDGYADNLLNALPILKKYHCHATIFVTAGLLGHPYGFWYDVLEDVLLSGRPLPPALKLDMLSEPLPLSSPEALLDAHDALLDACKKAPARLRRVLLHQVLEAAGIDPVTYNTPHPLLTEEQVATLAASPYIEVGAHTLTHPVLALLDEASQRREIIESAQILEKITHKPTRILAYPFGNSTAYNDISKKICCEAGLLGIANVQDSLPLNAGTLDPQDVPRRLVRNWTGHAFDRWLNARDRHALEQKTVAPRHEMLLQKLRSGSAFQAPALDSFRLEPVSRSFGLDRPGGQPIDRVYIERFLSHHSKDIHGRVLEIGAPTYTRKFGQHVTHSDILHAVPSPEATLVGDLATGEGIPKAAFDCIILTQTLQFIYDVHAALAHAVAALAPGGVLLLTASGISQISRYDMDRWGEFWRFTDKALERMLREAAPQCTVNVQSFGNAGTARAFLDGRSAVELPPEAFEQQDQDYQVTVCARVVRSVEEDMEEQNIDKTWQTVTVSDDMKGLKAYACAHRNGQYRVLFRGLVIHCTDLLSFYMAAKDIFIRGIYDFTTDNPTPLVIDGGAHIGLFSLRVKSQYPQARILAFEPDDEARALFQMNLSANGLEGVDVIPAGLHDSDGTLSFSSRGDDGNTLYGDDGNTTVQVTRLSRHLAVPVDFLKLNIEGGELPVLAECGEKLRQVQQLVLEYHGFPELGDRLHYILDILHKQGFRYILHDFDAETNPITKPPFRIDAHTRYFLLVAARRIEK